MFLFLYSCETVLDLLSACHSVTFHCRLEKASLTDGGEIIDDEALMDGHEGKTNRNVSQRHDWCQVKDNAKRQSVGKTQSPLL